MRCSPDGEEDTRISYDREARRVSLGQSESESLPQKSHGETIKLHIFVDRSVVEVFADDGRACLTESVYPSRSDSLGVGLFAHGGGARLRTMDLWELDGSTGRSADRGRA